MGVRPSVGFTYEEAQAIIDEVLSNNRLFHLNFADSWGRDQE
jgi:hypothetical protein